MRALAPARRAAARQVPAAGPWPATAAVTLFVLLAFRQAGTVPGTFGLNWAKILVTVCAFAWLVTRLAGQRARHSTQITLGLAICYVAISTVSFGEGLRVGWPHATELATGDTYMFLDLLILGWVGFVLTTCVRISAVRLLMQALVLGASVSALWAVVRVGTGIDLGALVRLPLVRGGDATLVSNLRRAGQTRPQGAAGHPLELALITTTAWPLALGLYYDARRRAARAWVWAGSVGILLLACLVALSRSALVGLLLAYVIMAWRFPVRRLRRHLVVAGVGLMVLVAARPSTIGNIVEAFVQSGSDPSVASRGRGLASSLPVIMAHPLLGQGFASYTVYPQVLLDNGYLGRTVETGLLGLATFVAALGWSLREALRARTVLLAGATAREQALGELCGALGAALAALGFGAFFLDIGGFQQAWLTMWTLIALCGCAGALARGRQESLRRGGLAARRPALASSISIPGHPDRGRGQGEDS